MTGRFARTDKLLHRLHVPERLWWRLCDAYDLSLGVPDTPENFPRRWKNHRRQHHTAEPGTWSYACPCLLCRWEQWWHEADNSVIPMPTEPHPEGEFSTYFAEREEWSGLVHPND